jgi:surface carbohydrate biosynthesis protein
VTGLADHKGGRERPAMHAGASPELCPAQAVGKQVQMAGSRGTVIVPVEEKVREFDSKLFLAAHLAAKGCEVIIGRRDQVEQSLDRFRRGVYLGMDLRAPKTYEMARLLGHRVAAWDEEAVVHYPAHIYASRRVEPRAAGCISALFAWGGDNVALWSDNPMIAGAAEVFQTGNPRSDMLRPECRPLYEEQAQKLRDEHGEFVLVNTNFGSINSINPKLNLYTVDKKGATVRGKGSVGMPGSYARALHEHRVGLFNAFRAMIPALAAGLPHAKIVVRPHPMEDWSAYRKELEGAYDNVRVIHEGSVIPWILASRLIVHNGCNTGIEAYCLGVPAIAYQPLAHEDYDSHLPNQLSHCVFDTEALVAAARSVLSGRIGEARTAARDELLDAYIDAREGRFAADRIAEILADLSEDHSESAGILDRQFGRYLMVDRRKRRESRDSEAVDVTIAHRFTGMSEPEVRERLAAMTRIAGLPEPSSIREIAPNVIRISGAASSRSERIRAFKRRRYEFPLSGLAVAPRRRYRMGTCLEYMKADPFIVERMEPAKPFNAEAPTLGAGGAGWRPSKLSPQSISHLCEIPNAYASALGGVFHSNGRVLHGASHKYDPVKKYRSIVRPSGTLVSRLNQTALVLDGPVAAVTASTQNYYYHWFVDVLPRIKMIEGRLAELPLYIAQGEAFQRETLRAFGVQSANTIEAGGQRLIRSAKLVVPCHQIMSGQEFPPWVIEFLRKGLLPLASPERRPKRRLYITRRNAAHRRVSNEEEICVKLETIGFETLALEDWPLADQIAAFRDAEIVIAPHGGGLTNLLFCSPGTFAVELFPRVTVDLYYRLAAAAGVEYAYVTDRTGRDETEREAKLSNTRIKLRLNDYTVWTDDIFSVLRRRGLTV